MKIFKRILASALVAATLLSFASCGKTQNTDNYTVGILQYTSDADLDTATEGFKQAISDYIGLDKVSFDMQVASGNEKIATTIAESFVSKEMDIIVANSDDALLTAANVTTRLPIIGTNIEDYGVTLDIAEYDGSPIGTNISGVSYSVSAEEKAKMVKELFPDEKNIGIIYCVTDEKSSAEAKAVNDNLKALEFTFENAEDFGETVKKASEKCKVLFIPDDAVAAENTDILKGLCIPKGIAIVTSDSKILAECGAYGLIPDYYKMGYETGRMASDVLKGKKDIANLAVENFTGAIKKYNPTVVNALSLTPPSDFIE